MLYSSMIPYFSIQGLRLCNWASQKLTTFRQTVGGFCHHFHHYCRGSYDTWIIQENSAIPLPYIQSVKNTAWRYDDTTCQLSHVPGDAPSRMSWLSTKVVIVEKDHEDREYDLDDFFEKLRIYSTLAPSLPVLFMAWCAHSKNWFPSDCIVQFHIIDHSGDETMLSLRVDEACLSFRNGKLYADKI